MKRIIEQSYDIIEAPSPFKERLLNELLESRDGIMGRIGKRFWEKPGFLASITAVIIVAVLIYGIWLPGNVEI
jgi:hypothetical protein